MRLSFGLGSEIPNDVARVAEEPLDIGPHGRLDRIRPDRLPMTASPQGTALGDLARKFAANQGEGLCLLGEQTHSPSRRRLRKEISEKLPKARWFLYDAIDAGVHQRAATKAFGKSVQPVFHYDSAKAILSLDCDFIGGEEDAHNNICRFLRVREGINGDSGTDAMGIANGHDMIFDHMSISWGRDETFSCNGSITNINLREFIKFRINFYLKPATSPIVAGPYLDRWTMRFTYDQ